MGASELDRAGPRARSSGCGCPAATQEADHRGRDGATPPQRPRFAGVLKDGPEDRGPLKVPREGTEAGKEEMASEQMDGRSEQMSPAALTRPEQGRTPASPDRPDSGAEPPELQPP